jgi:hypothetical protein
MRLSAHRHGLRQASYLVRAEPTPVIVMRHDDWYLAVTQGLEVIDGLRLRIQVDEVVVDALAIQCIFGGITLDTVVFSVNNNAHDSYSSFIAVPLRITKFFSMNQASSLQTSCGVTMK